MRKIKITFVVLVTVLLTLCVGVSHRIAGDLDQIGKHLTQMNKHLDKMEGALK